jgi:hypothetical protein
MKADRCRSCGAEIWWAITPKKRRMPLDPPGAHPEPNVDVWVSPDGILRTGVPDDGRPITPTTSHFATCPDADKHRRGRREPR